jgi:hypothetical protein
MWNNGCVSWQVKTIDYRALHTCLHVTLTTIIKNVHRYPRICIYQLFINFYHSSIYPSILSNELNFWTLQGNQGKEERIQSVKMKKVSRYMYLLRWTLNKIKIICSLRKAGSVKLVINFYVISIFVFLFPHEVQQVNIFQLLSKI